VCAGNAVDAPRSVANPRYDVALTRKNPSKEGKMRPWTPLLTVPVLAIGLMGTLLRLGHDASPVPAGSLAASPVAASPVAFGSPVATPLTVAEAVATVTALRATVEAQEFDVAVLTIRVDELETSVAILLEALPEQNAIDSFQQGQIDDLMARLAVVEAVVTESPVASPMATPGTSPTPS
jgi:hypothetical protein